MEEGREVASAITVRLGMAAGGVLGGLAGYWARAAGAPGQEGLLTWHTVVGAAAGLAVSWAALTWLARRHRGAGVVVGGLLAVAAALALRARFV